MPPTGGARIGCEENLTICFCAKTRIAKKLSSAVAASAVAAAVEYWASTTPRVPTLQLVHFRRRHAQALPLKHSRMHQPSHKPAEAREARSRAKKSLHRNNTAQQELKKQREIGENDQLVAAGNQPTASTLGGGGVLSSPSDPGTKRSPRRPPSGSWPAAAARPGCPAPGRARRTRSAWSRGSTRSSPNGFPLPPPAPEWSRRLPSAARG